MQADTPKLLRCNRKTQNPGMKMVQPKINFIEVLRPDECHIRRHPGRTQGLTVLAAQAPGLHSALLAAKMSGYDYVIIDGTLIETDPHPRPNCRGRLVVVGQT